jgi:2-polyprenyl-3-methyl-5-hydroxy-6-metoxy-1,4-benzoquinol methylase
MSSRDWQAFHAALVNDHMLASLLLNGPLRDPSLERRLTALRRDYLLRGVPRDAGLLLVHLAQQCFINEYAWAQDEEETALLDGLVARCAEGLPTSPGILLTLACYTSLGRLPGAARLLEREWPEPVRRVLKQQVSDGLREAALAGAAPALTAIRSGVSEEVRAHYEVNPYPRWATVAPPARSGDAVIESLVAGCGTGRSAISYARGNPRAKVLAVDLSRASLGYAMRKAEELGVGNLSFAQADLLELGALDRRFDLIECGGVLHHMADPFDGARVLAGLLRPGGLFFISVYSATARRVLEPAQRLARNFEPTPAGIRALRMAILNAPAGDPVSDVMEFGDFFSISTCRDLLMHRHERLLGVTDIRRMIDDNGLDFAGFIVQPTVRAAFEAEAADDPKADELDRWAAFEARHPRTFAGMYQFWAKKPA